MHAYIDESGDTGYTKKSTRYFILTAVTVEDALILTRIAKSTYKLKTDKKKRNMIHAHIESDKIKHKLIEKLENANISCIVFVFDKNKTQEKDPYLSLLEKVAYYFYKNRINKIILARRDTRAYYNKKIMALFDPYGLNLEFSTPTSEKSLQIADFYSWCVFSNLEYDHSEYFLKLKHQIKLIKLR